MKSRLVIAVCGGRDYDNQARVDRILNGYYTKYHHLTIIEGGQTGADSLARKWAVDRGARRAGKLSADKRVLRITENANWTRYGNGAGPLRNQAVIDKYKPDLVIAFPGGRGTADMVRRASAAGTDILELYE